MRVIVTVCLNAAIDVTYQVDRLVPGESHRAVSMHQRAGGKGLNVARILHQLGADVVVGGFAGGPTGAQIRADLAASGIAESLTPVAADSRRCVIVVDPAGPTVVNAPGPVVCAPEWAALVADVAMLLAEARVLVLAGSLPPGVATDAYRRLVGLAHGRDIPVVLDSDGPALVSALAAGPDVVKPNSAEAAAALGRPVASVADALDAGRRLCLDGARAAVVSRGADGVVAVAQGQAWRAAAPRRVDGNPTGAGDALAAALARGLAQGTGWPDRLRDGVATSAAAVAVHQGGGFDAALRASLLAEIDVEEL